MFTLLFLTPVFKNMSQNVQVSWVLVQERAFSAAAHGPCMNLVGLGSPVCAGQSPPAQPPSCPLLSHAPFMVLPGTLHWGQPAALHRLI